MNGVFAKDWVFAGKTFAAAMLALWIGFAADLDRPYWAMASACIASQPHVGATRSKALFRLMGTVLGATAAVALVPTLVDAPNLLIAALAGWVALMLALALLDRSPRGYVFMLAGYTAAIIGFPSVDSPGDIFNVAVARTEEISLGVVCATLLSGLILPTHAAPTLMARLQAWLADARRLAVLRLREQAFSDASVEVRRRLAADIVEIGLLTTQLRFDVSGPALSMPALHALHGRLLMTAPIVSSLSSRLAALRASGGVSPALAALVEETAHCLENEANTDALAALHAKLALEASLRRRLTDLTALAFDCRTLLRALREGRPGLPALTSGVEIEAATIQYSDPLMALYSGLSAAATVALVCVFWRWTAWPEGAVAAEMAAVACSFFAAQDDPAPAILRFLYATVVAVIVDGVYLFGVLPAVDGFTMLAVALAPTFLFYGWLTARPSTSVLGLALSANGATLMALQTTYSADFASFLNSGIAAVIGMAAAAVLTRLMRSVGADWSAWRLTRSNWLSLAQAAEGRGRGDRAAFAGLMVDRIGLIASRAGAITAEHAPNVGKLQADLRIGLNIVALRRARRQATPETARAIDGVLDALAAYYRRLARTPLGRPALRPDPSGLQRIDAAIATIAALDQPGERDALQGLIGVRLTLYPDAPPYAGGAAPGPASRRAAA